jgi:8-oxo-dGTP pyrophosphatase MutT (NUDIX family)
MPFEKSVGAVVFRREKKKILYLVLLKTPRKPSAPDYWGFPQGHMEKRETWEDTLIREMREETKLTNLKIIPDFYAWVKYFYRAVGEEANKRNRKNVGLNVFKISTFYLAEAKAKKIKLSREHIDYKWLEYKKALDLLTYKQTKKVLEKANRFLERSKTK